MALFRYEVADGLQELFWLIDESHVAAFGEDDQFDPAILACISWDIFGSLSS